MPDGTSRFKFAVPDLLFAKAWAKLAPGAWRVQIAQADDGTFWASVVPPYADEEAFRIVPESQAIG